MQDTTRKKRGSEYACFGRCGESLVLARISGLYVVTGSMQSRLSVLLPSHVSLTWNLMANLHNCRETTSDTSSLEQCSSNETHSGSDVDARAAGHAHALSKWLEARLFAQHCTVS